MRHVRRLAVAALALAAAHNGVIMVVWYRAALRAEQDARDWHRISDQHRAKAVELGERYQSGSAALRNAALRDAGMQRVIDRYRGDEGADLEALLDELLAVLRQ